MKSVMFSFADSATEESQDRARSEIQALPGVHNVGRISPDAKKPALRRMCYADVDDEAAEGILDQLRSKVGVESADLPAERRLV